MGWAVRIDVDQQPSVLNQQYVRLYHSPAK